MWSRSDVAGSATIGAILGAMVASSSSHPRVRSRAGGRSTWEVARSNLRALFAAGITQNLLAQDVFTNRVSEMEAFQAAIDASSPDESAVRPLAEVVDPALPRRNVLVYYGLGGIGKTRLSEVLEDR